MLKYRERPSIETVNKIVSDAQTAHTRGDKTAGTVAFTAGVFAAKHGAEPLICPFTNAEMAMNWQQGIDLVNDANTDRRNHSNKNLQLDFQEAKNQWKQPSHSQADGFFRS